MRRQAARASRRETLRCAAGDASASGRDTRPASSIGGNAERARDIQSILALRQLPQAAEQALGASRRASTIVWPSRSIHSAARASTGSSLCFLRAGDHRQLVLAAGRARRRTASRAGHTRQRGAVGEQIVAPSSIRPWLSVAGRGARGQRGHQLAGVPPQRLRCRRCDLMSSLDRRTRARARARRCRRRAARVSPNAIDAIAPAVYGPMPGTSRSSAARDGSPASRDRLRAGVEVARARVVAEARPRGEHVVERRIGERAHASETAPSSAPSTGSRSARASAAA